MDKVTTVQRLNRAVYRNGLHWTDISARIQKDHAMNKDAADELVADVITKKNISMPVAAAIIEMITEKHHGPSV